MKTLIVYGTRCGATSETSEEIARKLREEGFYVKLVNLKEEKIKDISEYELVVVGSGMQIDKWTSEAEEFLKKFRKDLDQKKVAIFVSSAFLPLNKIQGKTAEVDRAREKYLEQKAESHSLKPIEMTIFGGVLDFNKMGFITRKTLSWVKPSLEAAGYKETKPGVYDTRDWNEIREWTKRLVLKARYL
jgi:menaquinone-dependent protoporphyrinogen IX oxidase